MHLIFIYIIYKNIIIISYKESQIAPAWLCAHSLLLCSKPGKLPVEAQAPGGISETVGPTILTAGLIRPGTFPIYILSFQLWVLH